MIKNYIKIAFRNLLKQRVYSLVNISGLGFGMACVLLIVIFVKDELSYDRFHEDAGDIYRVAWWTDNPQTRTPHPMAQALVKDFPQVVSATSLSPLWGPGLTREVFSVRNLEEDITFDERNILSVDSTFFEVFSFELLKGNKKEVLRNPGGILLSESTAIKYFGHEDPIGKQLSINDDNALVVVEGVFADVPVNSHFHFDALLSYVTMKVLEPGNPYYTWADFGHFNYIRLTPGSDPMKLQNQLMEWITGYIQVSEEDRLRIKEGNIHFKLQPITDIHLKSRIRWELEPNGNIHYVYIMTAAAFLILVIASVNFMNLATARSTERSKEIGIRKSLGAYKQQLTGQFLGESVLTAILGMILAGFIAEISLPLFNEVTGKSLSIEYWQDPSLIAWLLGVGAFTGLLSGLYPAFFLASIHPIISLKGVDKIKPRGTSLRKGLVIFQFVISMTLVTGSLVIHNQLLFIHDKDLGFDQERIMVIPLKNYDLLGSFEAIRAEMLKIDGVVSVSGTSNIPGRQFNQNSIFKTDDPLTRISSSEVFVDHDIFDVLGLEMVAGRAFSRDNPADSNAFILNETAAQNIGLQDPVGQEITWEWDNDGQPPTRGTVIGIVKDFHYNSLHEPVRPLLFSQRTAYNHVLIRLNAREPREIIAGMEKVWNQFEDRFGFEYGFLSNDLQAQYIGEHKTAQVFSGFSIIAVVIACFGLFGIAYLSYAQRSKEVSIRKVLGASRTTLLRLLLSDFVRLLVVAAIIAVPIAWYLMDNWLQSFTYRVSLGVMDFVLSAAVLMIVSLFTVSYLTWQTAKQNPVDNLKEQ